MCSWNCSWFSVVNPLVHLEHLIFTFFRDWVMAQVLPPLGLEEGKGDGVLSLVQLVAVVTGEDPLTELMVLVGQQECRWDLIGSDTESWVPISHFPQIFCSSVLPMGIRYEAAGCRSAPQRSSPRSERKMGKQREWLWGRTRNNRLRDTVAFPFDRSENKGSKSKSHLPEALQFTENWVFNENGSVPVTLHCLGNCFKEQLFNLLFNKELSS